MVIYPKSIQQISIQLLRESAQELGYPTAVWRMPNSQTTHFLISFSKVPTQGKPEIDELGSGFAVSPFINPSGENTYFLPADVLFSISRTNEISFHKEPSSSAIFEEIAQNARIKQAQTDTQKQVFFERPKEIEEPTAQKLFVENVKKAISEIQAGNFQKVVLSRTKSFSLPANFSIWESFQTLTQTYSSAFVSLVDLPFLSEVWIGASPEILVSQNDQTGRFRTMSLAGTQPAFTQDGQEVKPEDALWRQKEIEEQALVGRYIINCFKKVRIREYDEFGPQTVRAGNLLHLRSDFEVDYKSIHFPQITSVMLDLLHPTSAVCGMPKKTSLQFILANEQHDRSFYAGYLGPVNIEGQTNLFVHLRNMCVKNQQATLFAGCGITADSSPEKEWIETELKTQTLSKVLFGTK
ncbi:MAG: chorismate-binding protein [Spirosomataceae bacterium]